MKIRHSAAKQRSRGRGRTERKIDRPRAKTKNAGKLPADSRKECWDTYNVREWFAADPAACISDPAAQKILREYEHPYRHWVKFLGKDEERRIRAAFDKAVRVKTKERAVGIGKAKRAAIEKTLRESAEKGIRRKMRTLSWPAVQVLVNDQSTAWSESLRKRLNRFLPHKVVDRFADYLTGFLLVQENETPRSSARKLKKLLRKLNGRPVNPASILPASLSPPHQESLKTRLIALMSEELVALGYTRKKIAHRFLPPLWDAVGEGIRDSSFLRTRTAFEAADTHQQIIPRCQYCPPKIFALSCHDHLLL